MPPPDEVRQAHRAEGRGLRGRSEIYAVEITHAQLTDPVRAVMDSVPHTIEGATYNPVAFHFRRPQDVTAEVHRAEISVDQVGRPLMAWVRISNGGRGARVRGMQVTKPPAGGGDSLILWSQTLPMSVVRANAELLAMGLVSNPHEGQKAVGLRYDPIVAPGLYGARNPYTPTA